MKNIYSIIISLFIYQMIFSQTAPEIEWQNTIGGNDDDFGSPVIQTEDGGFLVGGSSRSNISGDKTENRKGGYDNWLLKLSSSGEIEWQNTIGGNGDDELYVMKQTSEGGYIIGGGSNSDISGDKSEPHVGFSDYWILKLNSDGEIEWQNTIGGSKADWLYSIEQTEDGGYILGGGSWSGITGDKTEIHFGNEDYWVIKLDSGGEIEWQKTLGGNNTESLCEVNKTLDGGYIVAGRSASGISGNKTEDNIGSSGASDFWIVKLDSEGEIVWQETIGGNDSEILADVEVLSNGSYVLVGYTNSSATGNISEINNGEDDCWIVKLSSDGSIEWENLIGGNSNDFLVSLGLTNEGGFIISGGSYSGISGDKTEASRGGLDIWVVKIDAIGNIVWDKTLGGNHDDFSYTIMQASDGGFIIGNDSNSDISGDKTEPNIGERDYWVIKLFPEEIEPCLIAPTDLFATNITINKAKLHWSADADAIKYKVQYRESTSPVWISLNATTNSKKLPGLAANTTYKYRVRSQCSATSISPWSAVATFTTLPLKELISADEIEINIYPNPNTGTFNLNIQGLNDDELIEIRITNLLGEEIYSQIISDEEELIQTIELNHAVESGMYVIEITNGDKIFTEQIIISK